MKRALPLCLVYLASGTLVVAPGWTRAGDATAPAPATVWPAGPLELVMAFPAPVEPQWSRTLVGKAIAYFDHDRGAPGGPAAAAPLGSLRIAGVRLADQGRTLLLATDPHPRIARYELILGPKREPAKVVSYDLSGVEADWSSSKDDAGAEPAWKGWWPDLDLDATRRLTRGSALHERALALLEQPGRLSLSTLLSLPPGENMVLIEASGALSEVTLGDEQPVVDPRPGPNGMYRVILSGRSLGVPLYLSLNVETGRRGRPLAIHASRARGKSQPLQAIERQEFTVPWAPIPPASAAPPELPVPDLTGGNVQRGETLFYGDQTRCSQCHAFRGRGGTVGPDLTEIGRKGKEHVYRSIAAPRRRDRTGIRALHGRDP